MRALQVVSHEGPSDLRIVEVDPANGALNAQDGDGLVTIRVEAAGVSVPDLLQTRGQYQVQPPLPFVPGSEIAGTVMSAPAGSGLSVGAAVAAYTPSGGMAETARAQLSLTFPLPAGWSYAEGACFVVNYHTAFFALVTRGALAAGETVVVHGAAGGLGTACVQVAAGLGAHVVAVVSDGSKAEFSRSAGAHAVVASSSWKEEVLAAHPRGVDVVLDPVGGNRALDSMRVLAEAGRWVVVGFASGQIPEIRTNRLLLKNITAMGASWGAYAFSKPAYLAEVHQQILELVNGGAIRPAVGAVYPLEQAVEAFLHAESRDHVGKVVIEL